MEVLSVCKGSEIAIWIFEMATDAICLRFFFFSGPSGNSVFILTFVAV